MVVLPAKVMPIIGVMCHSATAAAGAASTARAGQRRALSAISLGGQLEEQRREQRSGDVAGGQLERVLSPSLLARRMNVMFFAGSFRISDE